MQLKPIPVISSPSSIANLLRLFINPPLKLYKSSSIAEFAVWLKFSKNSLIFFSKLKLLLSIDYFMMLSLKLHLIYNWPAILTLNTLGKHLRMIFHIQFSANLFYESIFSFLSFSSLRELGAMHKLCVPAGWFRSCRNSFMQIYQPEKCLKFDACEKLFTCDLGRGSW